MMTNPDFSRSLSLLRQEKGLSQRMAARDLGISQALLSHYENGIREPGLAFVVKACDYYNVSADFLLGRTLSRDGMVFDVDVMPDASQEKDNVLRGSVMAALSKKLLVNSVSVLFDLLGKLGSREAIKGAADYIGIAVYKTFRHLYRADGSNNEELFALPAKEFLAGAPNAEMMFCEMDYFNALQEQVEKKEPFPDMSDESLSRNYPGQYQSLLQIIHASGERISKRLSK